MTATALELEPVLRGIDLKMVRSKSPRLRRFGSVASRVMTQGEVERDDPTIRARRVVADASRLSVCAFLDDLGEDLQSVAFTVAKNEGVRMADSIIIPLGNIKPFAEAMRGMGFTTKREFRDLNDLVINSDAHVWPANAADVREALASAEGVLARMPQS